MKEIDVTAHARLRMRQRGISTLQILLLRHFGAYHYQKGGSEEVYIPNKLLQELREALDGLDRISMIEADAGQVVTAFRKQRRLHNTQYAA